MVEDSAVSEGVAVDSAAEGSLVSTSGDAGGSSSTVTTVPAGCGRGGNMAVQWGAETGSAAPRRPTGSSSTVTVVTFEHTSGWLLCRAVAVLRLPGQPAVTPAGGQPPRAVSFSESVTVTHSQSP